MHTLPSWLTALVKTLDVLGEPSSENQVSVCCPSTAVGHHLVDSMPHPLPHPWDIRAILV